jgi:hypothetical protein
VYFIILRRGRTEVPRRLRSMVRAAQLGRIAQWQRQAMR